MKTKHQIPVARRFLWWLLKRWVARQPRVGFVLTRWDGVKVDVGCMACGTCKNYFWAQRVEVELPGFCPYCGVRFQTACQIDGDEMKEIQIIDEEPKP